MTAHRWIGEVPGMTTIRPKSCEEAKAVLRYMAAHEMFDRNLTDAVLGNLVG